MTSTDAITDPIAVAEKLRDEFRAGSSQRDMERQYPDAEVDLLKRSGLLAMFVPREYGGLDLDYRTAMRVTSILAEGDANLGHIPQAHHCGVEYLKRADAKPIMDELFPRIVNGSLVQSAFSERNANKPVDFFSTTLDKDEDGLLLTGKKFYCTGSRWADAFYVPCGIQPGASPDFGGHLQGLVWVNRDSNGVEVVDDWDGMGQRLTASGSVSFDQTRVDPDLVLTTDDDADRAYDYTGTHAQILFCAIYIGIARSALADGIEYLKNSSRPWIHSGVSHATEDPYVLHRVGSMDIAIDAAESTLDRAADSLQQARSTLDPDECRDAAVAVSRAKAVATEAVLKVTQEIFQVCGTSSARRRTNFDRHWRNARTLTLHDPVDYKYKIVGQARFGIAPPISAWS